MTGSDSASGWSRCPIGEKFRVDGKTRRGQVPLGQGAFLPMEALPSNRLFVDQFESRDITATTSGTPFSEGDLLVAKITPCFENGKQGIVRNVPGGVGMATTEVLPISPLTEDAQLPFLAYFLRDANVRAALAERMEGATGRQRLSRSVLAHWLMPFPPPMEQQAIVGLLDKLETQAGLQQQVAMTLKELKAATMAKLFREGLRGERLKQTEIGEIPESWEASTLGSLCDISTGTTPSTAEPANFVGTTAFIKTSEIDGGPIRQGTQFVSDAAVTRYRLKIYSAGTVLLAMYGQGKTRGHCSLLAVPATTSQNAAAIEPGEALDPRFVWLYLTSRYAALRETGNLGHLSHLNLGYVRDLKIPVPSRVEQGEIASMLLAIDARLRAEEGRCGQSRSLFTSTLHSLMSGALRLPLPPSV